MKVTYQSRLLLLMLLFTLMVSGCKKTSDMLVSAQSNHQKSDHHGMEEKSSNQEDSMRMTNSVVLDQRGRLMAGIKTDTARETMLHEITNLLGTARINENEVQVITSRIQGRIDRLYLKTPGEQVQAAQPLYSIYSEELLADQKDYLNALDKAARFGTQKKLVDELIASARQKLKLWDMTDAQIEQLAQHQQAHSLVTYSSPVSGFLSELNIYEGQYVAIGSPLFRIASLSSLWVETQVYAHEINFLYQHPEVTVAFEALPAKTFHAQLEFISPALEGNQKINLARFRIDNGQRLIKPGMMAYVAFKRNGKRTLVVPKAALLIGNSTSLWVETKPNVFELRMVQTGLENKMQVEIVKGLSAGEVVVIQGGYLLNSAYILKSGAGMQGMEM